MYIVFTSRNHILIKNNIYVSCIKKWKFKIQTLINLRFKVLANILYLPLVQHPLYLMRSSVLWDYQEPEAMYRVEYRFSLKLTIYVIVMGIIKCEKFFSRIFTVSSLFEIKMKVFSHLS